MLVFQVISLMLLSILYWYAKLTAVVRWNHALSKPFDVKFGIRQGAVLSPSLFNIFINVIITNLKLASNGYFIQNRFIGCLLYADDIFLLSPYVRGLQRMLNSCHKTIVELGLVVNCLKSYCVFWPTV